MTTKTTYEFIILSVLYALIDMQKNNVITPEQAESIMFLPKHKCGVASNLNNKKILKIIENGFFYTDYLSLCGEDVLQKNLVKNFNSIEKLLKSIIIKNDDYLQKNYKSLIDIIEL